MICLKKQERPGKSYMTINVQAILTKMYVPSRVGVILTLARHDLIECSK